jgi:hypothetical protein
LIIAANGVSDRLPAADVAFSMYLGHHLSERDLRQLIRNVGRSCRRFLLLDLVRHRLPLTMFKLFMVPVVCPIVATDGQRSIRRSYTPAELMRIARDALAGTRARFRHSTSALYIRQILDITLGVSGGVTADHVLYNFTGTSGTISTQVGNIIYGTVLAPNYTMNIDGTWVGELASGGAMSLLSGVKITSNGFNCSPSGAYSAVLLE